MSVLMYWKERLVAKNPLFSEAKRLEKIHVKHRRSDMDNPWPHSVARSALFEDYLIWHEEAYLVPFRAVDYYQSNPDRLPAPADELGFFSTIAPWLYLVGKKQQVRTYLVPVQEFYDGEWYETKKNKYFVRLCTWEQHVAGFEMITGVPLDMQTEYYHPERARTVADAQTEYHRQIAENREVMEAAMGNE
jgi:hypothetical protein